MVTTKSLSVTLGTLQELKHKSLTQDNTTTGEGVLCRKNWNFNNFAKKFQIFLRIFYMIFTIISKSFCPTESAVKPFELNNYFFCSSCLIFYV